MRFCLHGALLIVATAVASTYGDAAPGLAGMLQVASHKTHKRPGIDRVKYGCRLAEIPPLHFLKGSHSWTMPNGSMSKSAVLEAGEHSQRAI